MTENPYAPTTPASPSARIGADMGRPTGVTVLAILSFVLGALSVLGTVLTVASFLFAGMVPVGGAQDPMSAAMQESVVFRTFTYVNTGIGSVFALVLLAAAIGLWLMKSWGRTASIVYAIYSIVFSLLTVLLTAIYVLLPVLADDRSGEAAFVAIVVMVAVGLGALLGCVFPIAVLIYLTRPGIKAAFASG